MISENSRRQDARGLRKFAYDVGVNVLANLVAAAIIYLLGTAAGVLPSDPRLIGSALFVIFGMAGIGFVVASQVVPRGRIGRRLFDLAQFCVAGFLGVAGLLQSSTFWRWMLLYGAISMLAAAVVTIATGRPPGSLRSPGDGAQETQPSRAEP
ncbi:hypothetical protein ACFP2T_13565 [Plantactinospora solaniradicis]|uniref:Uncharacterized protein n=1 Tax=Plantactinospora solaniradicis TaxID=1723736 RepID=A0ABW1K6P3_9ACTN